MIARPKTHRILIVDDEPDVHAVTKLSLKSVKHKGQPLEIASAMSGKEAVENLRANPHTAVVLLDVVMESQTAGLDACKAIRGELGNRFVRILLRTGQPGVAPERKTIDDYDLDGYLPKTEMDSNRLYSAVRTALRAFDELVELDRHRSVLGFLHSSVASLRSFEPLETTLGRILETAVALAPAPVALLELGTFRANGEARQLSLSLGADAAATRTRVVSKIAQGLPAAPGPFADGWLAPIVVHRDLGHGWLYLGTPTLDDLAQSALPLLAQHASNALYASVAREMLEAREGPFYDSLSV